MSANEAVFITFFHLAVLLEALGVWQYTPAGKPLVLYRLGILGDLLTLYCTAALALGTILLLVWGLLNADWYVVIASFLVSVPVHRFTLFRFVWWRAFITSAVGPPVFASLVWATLWMAWSHSSHA